MAKPAPAPNQTRNERALHDRGRRTFVTSFAAIALGTIFLASAHPAQAARFVSPNNCEHMATVQQESCRTWQILSCGPRPVDRRIYDYQNGVLKGVADYHGGLVQLHYEDLAEQNFYDLELSEVHKVAIDRLDPRDPRQSLKLTATFDDRVVGATVFQLNLFGANDSSILDGRQILKWSGSTSYTYESGDLNSSASHSYYYDIELGAVIGVRDRYATDQIFDYTPVELALPGETGFGETLSLCERLGMGPAPSHSRSIRSHPAAAAA
ncbi:MAG: hypothetical protein AAGM38_05615 [Pseudomonadota bacterium]